MRPTTVPTKIASSRQDASVMPAGTGTSQTPIADASTTPTRASRPNASAGRAGIVLETPGTVTTRTNRCSPRQP